jgi:hypothetical protein
MRVVASLTTIPSRIDTWCKNTIDSIIDQVDHVYVGVATHYRRFNTGIEIPTIYNEEPYKGRVTFVFGEDKGPATKYLGSLSVIPDDTWVFFCDDDQEYKPGLIERMKSVCIDKTCVYQNRYETFSRWGTSGGLIHGYVGNMAHTYVLCQLPFFPLPECAYHIDDQWMSVYYKMTGVEICSTGIDSYNDIFKKLLPEGYELFGPDSLAQLGTRNEKIHQLESYFGVRFIPNSVQIEINS